MLRQALEARLRSLESGLPRSVLLLQVCAQRGHGPRSVAFHRATADPITAATSAPERSA